MVVGDSYLVLISLKNKLKRTIQFIEWTAVAIDDLFRRKSKTTLTVRKNQEKIIRVTSNTKTRKNKMKWKLSKIFLNYKNDWRFQKSKNFNHLLKNGEEIVVTLSHFVILRSEKNNRCSHYKINAQICMNPKNSCTIFRNLRFLTFFPPKYVVSGVEWRKVHFFWVEWVCTWMFAKITFD